jgi:hypothetical protein
MYRSRSIAIATSLCGISAGGAVKPALKFSAPLAAPPAVSDIIPHDFTLFSWPTHWFTDFAGNASHPNLFSRDILELLANKSGGQPFIRVGGTST